jgi:long-chain-fatty-acid---luciferin-component ligase
VSTAPELSSPPLVRTLEVSSPLDRVIFEMEDWWSMPEPEQVAFRLDAMRAALEHHLARCPPYAAFAAGRSFDPRSLRGPEDLALLPQVPTAVFKRMDLASVPAEALVRTFLSSGTTGARSRVPRDELTLERLTGSLRPDLAIWSDVVSEVDMDEGGEVVNLGPARSEAGDVWFSYVMSLVGVFARTTHCVTDGRLDLDAAVGRVSRCVADGRFVCVVGPPAFVLALCQRLDGDPPRAESLALVVTGGGWKRAEGQRVDEASFRRIVMASLGLARPAQVRDLFNQVELNTILIECDQGRKHVPPWVEVIVRDPGSLAPVAAGTRGLLSFLDASAYSFPCFVVGEDLGRLWPDRCACGRGGQTVAIERRIEGSTHQGCAPRLLESVRLT